MKRLNVIDVAKGLGIIFVVYAHTCYQHELLTLIYSFHMPLFFLISGMLYDKNKYSNFKSFFSKRFKALFIPYVIFELASIGCLYFAERAYSSAQLFDVSKERYIEYIQQIIISNWSGTHVNQPLWFVPCLLLIEVLYFYISKMKKRYIVPTCFALACCGWVLESGMLNFDNKTLPWSLDSAIFALGFYAIGNLTSKHVQHIIRRIKANKNKVAWCVGIIAVTMMIWVPLGLMNEKITMGSKILNNGFLLYINGVLGTITILALSILLEKNKFLTFCGRNSFYIMATHYIIRNYLVKPAYIIITADVYNKESMTETILPFLIIFSLSFLFTVIYINIKKSIQKKNV